MRSKRQSYEILTLNDTNFPLLLIEFRSYLISDVYWRNTQAKKFGEHYNIDLVCYEIFELKFLKIKYRSPLLFVVLVFSVLTICWLEISIISCLTIDFKIVFFCANSFFSWARVGLLKLAKHSHNFRINLVTFWLVTWHIIPPPPPLNLWI